MKVSIRYETILNKYVLRFGLILSCILLPYHISVGCGDGYEDYYKGYSFIHAPMVSEVSRFTPYILNFGDFHETDEELKTRRNNDNLKEWQETFCEAATLEEIADIVYKATVPEMESITRAIKRKENPMDYNIKDNTFALQLKTSKCTDVVNYLIFAKRCEPYVISKDEWSGPQVNRQSMLNLIDDGRKLFKKTDSHWVRLRYAYQLVRLAHYAGENQLALDLYDYLKPKIDERVSIINYWLLGHKAGALKRLGKNVEASYWYSLIFQYCPSKREAVYRSFYIKNDEEWEQCLALCRNDSERATLYMMRTMDKNSKGVEEMQHIYELDPTSRHLQSILLREIKKLEGYFLGHSFRRDWRGNSRFYNRSRDEMGKYMIDLQKFTQKVADEKKISNPQFWQVSNGYLEYLSGDLYNADKTFRALEGKIEDEDLAEQLKVFQLLIKIHSYEKMEHEEEQEIAKIIESKLFLKYPGFKDFLYDRLADLYEKGGNKGKAFLCHNDLTGIESNPRLEIINDLLSIYDKPEQNEFEKLFLKDENGFDIKNRLLDIQGTYYFARGMWGEAKRSFGLIPLAEKEKYQFNPFTERFEDCIHCPFPDSLDKFYNKAEIVDKLLEFEYKSKSDVEYGPEYFYWMGTALYNMSYFGHAWGAQDFYRQSTTWYKMPKSTKEKPLDYWEQLDCSKALYYFDLCRQTTYNKELGARATFMAAKCQRNEYYTGSSFDYSAYRRNRYLPPDKYNTFFALLKKDYADTEFFETIIEECKYFDYYVNR